MDGGFAYGGWTFPDRHDDIGAHFFAAMSEADALLLGRKTWEGHGAAFNPMPDDDPFGGAMNSVKKYVVSTTLTSTDLAQFDDHPQQRGRGSAEAEGAGRQEHPDGWQQRAGAYADRERSGGRIRAARLPAGAGRRESCSRKASTSSWS